MSFDNIISNTVVNIDAAEESRQLFVITDTTEEPLESFVNTDTTEANLCATVEETLEVLVSIVASPTAEEDIGVSNSTNNKNTTINPNKINVKELV